MSSAEDKLIAGAVSCDRICIRLGLVPTTEDEVRQELASSRSEEVIDSLMQVVAGRIAYLYTEFTPLYKVIILWPDRVGERHVHAFNSAEALDCVIRQDNPVGCRVYSAERMIIAPPRTDVP